MAVFWRTSRIRLCSTVPSSWAWTRMTWESALPRGSCSPLQGAQKAQSSSMSHFTCTHTHAASYKYIWPDLELIGDFAFSRIVVAGGQDRSSPDNAMMGYVVEANIVFMTLVYIHMFWVIIQDKKIIILEIISYLSKYESFKMGMQMFIDLNLCFRVIESLDL